MGDAARRVVAGALSADAWADFGWLPVDDTDPADGRHRLHFAWDDAHLNVISHHAGEVTRHDGALRCDAMYRHESHTQALLVLESEAVMAVAAPGTAFAVPADADRIRAFVLRPLDVFVLHPGTWHWGPFPLGPEPVRLLNLQGFRYAEDNARVDLAAAGAAVDIVADGNGSSG